MSSVVLTPLHGHRAAWGMAVRMAGGDKRRCAMCPDGSVIVYRTVPDRFRR